MIVAAAVRHERVWALPAPARHHNVIDSDEGFVSRSRAREIALREGQVERTDHATLLFSEDLW